MGEGRQDHSKGCKCYFKTQHKGPCLPQPSVPRQLEKSVLPMPLALLDPLILPEYANTGEANSLLLSPLSSLSHTLHTHLHQKQSAGMRLPGISVAPSPKSHLAQAKPEEVSLPFPHLARLTLPGTQTNQGHLLPSVQEDTRSRHHPLKHRWEENERFSANPWIFNYLLIKNPAGPKI